MQLHAVTYSERAGTPREWSLKRFEPSQRNLIVGKNATGKTRCLNLIGAFAEVLLKSRVVGNAHWIVEFNADGDSFIEYELEIADGKVKTEKFTKDSVILMGRAADGTGKIHSDALDKDLDFGLASDQIAAVAKRDRIQHPFLERLSEWADGVRHYQFARIDIPVVISNLDPDRAPPVHPRQIEQVVRLFRQGESSFGEEFTSAVNCDMNAIGYDIEAVSVAPQETGILNSLGLSVKENDLSATTEHTSLSQGMLRALTILILINYAACADSGDCVLVDDIGEGLDFERSTSLIKLLVAKLAQRNVQLVMTTNDRFVMNAVPLENWLVLVREGARCRILNERSHPEAFSDFKFTGLNNFDFLSTRFWETSIESGNQP